MNDIRNTLDSCISILKTIEINYMSPIGPRTNALILEIRKLIPLLEKEQPYIANILRQSLANIVLNHTYINAYVFGDIRTTLKILDNIYSKTDNIEKSCNRRKIFISHSSKDKNIVEEFVDHILLMGIGIQPENIFCTSIEDLAIKNGEDIRRHIQSNIQNADFSILLISDNYKKSEICLNEMGAVWAYNNNVRLYLLPNTRFEKIGWLCDTKQAEMLYNSITLDGLKMELSEHYSLKDQGTTWSRQRETFVKSFEVKKKKSSMISQGSRTATVDIGLNNSETSNLGDEENFDKKVG